MSKKTLAEIEARHAARAEAKGMTLPGQQAPRTAPAGMAEEADERFDDHDQYDDDEHEQEQHAPESYDDNGEDLRREVEQLRQQLAATQGRVAPEQRRAEEYRQFYETERQQREREAREYIEQIEALQSQMESANLSSSIEDILSPEERDLFDEDQLSAMAKIADAVAKRRAPKINARAEALEALREHEKQRVADYRTEVLTDPSKGLSTLGNLAHDNRFQEWLEKDENADFDPLMNSLLHAGSQKEIDRYARAVAKRIARFNDEAKSRRQPASRQTDPKQSLTSAMQRRPQRVSEADMKNQLAEATRLSRSRNPEDQRRAKAILDNL